MNYLKKLGISFLFAFGIFVVLSFLLSLFYYFNGISSNINSIFKMIIPFLSFFIAGFLIGRGADKKGWLEGIKVGSIFLGILFVINLIFFRQSMAITDFIYYAILLTSSTLGSMIGIQKKKQS